MPAPRLPLVFGTALLAAGGCSDRSVRHINSVPTATIVSPLEGAEVLEGSTVEMRGEVGDYEDDPEDLDIHWMVGNERVCADSSTAEAGGATACETVLTESDTLTLKVFDTESESSEDFIDIVVLPNEAPAIEIASPEHGDRGYSGEKFILFATVSDDHDAPGDLELVWLADDIVLEPIGGSLDADGEYTGSLDVDDLEPGTYTLKATVTDSLGKAKSDSVEITAFGPNIDPSCEISAPEEDEVFTTEDTVTIKGSCADEETSANLLDVVIESGTDGVLAEDVLVASSGAFSEVVGPLSEGTHSLSVTVTDDYGTQGAAIVTIEVCGEAWYEDADGDGYGNAEEPVLSCEQLSGYVTDGTDCDDDDVFTYPGAADKESSTDCMTDADEDGYGDSTAISPVTAGTDCDDSDADISPLASEICDGVDNDCDGDEDDDDSSLDTSTASTWYADSDGDGFGDEDDLGTLACDQPSGMVADHDDCDDGDGDVNPDETEVCDEDDSDEDCNGVADDDDSGVDTSTMSDWYADTDGDSYGDSSDSQTVCNQPASYVSDDTDCHDDDEDTYPGVASSEGSSTDCMTDADGDGYGDDSPVSGVTAGSDCDDDESAVSPAATEECDDIDNDCDDDIDDADSDLDTSTASTWYADSDSDGYSDSATSQTTCDQPSGYIEASSSADCDDSDEFTYPGIASNESSSTACMTDADEDGYGDDAPASGVTAGTDCDDGDSTVSPAASEICDGVDNDCDGDDDDDDSSLDTSTASTWYADSDGDGFGDEDDPGTLACDQPSGMVADHDDCDDGDGGVNPDETEVCDEDNSDEDCNGVADDDDSGVDTSTMSDWYTDSDGDDYGDEDGSATTQCDDPGSSAADNTDCDDTADNVNPGEVEACDGVDNDCDGNTDVGLCGDFTLSEADATYTGKNSGDQFGISFSMSGDIDGDGQDDLVVGANYYDNTSTDDGAVYIYYGPTTSGGSTGAADGSLLGTGADQLGNFVDSSGDLDGDGYDDMVLCESVNDDAATNAGAAYVIYGPISGSFSSTASSYADGELQGSNSTDLLCSAARIVADIDDDGLAELFVGITGYDGGSYSNSGAAMVWYGSETDPFSSVTDVFSSGASGGYDIYIDGDSNNDYMGNSAAEGGDIDGDGYGDLVVGSYGYGTGGAALLMYGPLSGVGNIAGADADVRFLGQNSNDYVGYWVSTGGDATGDGQTDLLVGDYRGYDASGSTRMGAAYLFSSGSYSGDVSVDSYNAVLYGSSANDAFSYDTLLADIDGDGTADAVLGAYLNDDGGSNAGAVYVVFGPLSGAYEVSTDADVEILGDTAGYRTGLAIRAGDINGDGIEDIGISSPYATGSNTGQIDLFFGGLQ